MNELLRSSKIKAIKVNLTMTFETIEIYPEFHESGSIPFCRRAIFRAKLFVGNFSIFFFVFCWLLTFMNFT
jgi:hypothetical protein